MSENPNPRSPLSLILVAVVAALLGFAGAWGWQLTPIAEKASGEAVHAYLLENPEVLPEAMEVLQQREAWARLAPFKAQVEQPFPGAVLGNPKGKRTLVEFSDYACGYCRHSVPEVEALIASDPELRVVIREFPILSADSVAAARMALAAAEQGKFEVFHKAMFAAGRPTPQAIDGAAKAAGLDMERARKVANSSQVESELSRNSQFGEAIGFNGTPSWIAGRNIYSGAVGMATLAKALGSPEA